MPSNSTHLRALNLCALFFMRKASAPVCVRPWQCGSRASKPFAGATRWKRVRGFRPNLNTSAAANCAGMLPPSWEMVQHANSELDALPSNPGGLVARSHPASALRVSVLPRRSAPRTCVQTLCTDPGLQIQDPSQSSNSTLRGALTQPPHGPHRAVLPPLHRIDCLHLTMVWALGLRFQDLELTPNHGLGLRPQTRP